MKITILTAAFNPGSVLGDCLASVAEQRLPESVQVDHFVLDGGSSDGTIDILRAWGDSGPGRRYRSEPDGGFYEALNTGIQVADGDIVGILNADDFYFDDLVLARVAEAFSKPGVEGVYGDLVYVKGEGNLAVGRPAARIQIKRFWKSGNYCCRNFWWGWMPPHPTVFVRREVYERYGAFRTDFGSAADYEWMLRVMVGGQVPFHYIPHVQVAMRVGGMSNRSLAVRLAANRNDRRAWTVNGLTPLPWTFLLKPLRKLPQWFARLPCA
ncbi:MAG: glycosyltransferase family 2 protein [Verrucomicrobiota bacterium]